MNWFLNFLQNNGQLKFLACIVLSVILYIIYGVTKNDMVLYLYIIPLLYVVPLFLVSFVYAWIIYPIILIFKKKK